jgi:hypothetical protein
MDPKLRYPMVFVVARAAGAIVGIAIGSLVGALVIGGIVVWLRSRSQSHGTVSKYVCVCIV